MVAHRTNAAQPLDHDRHFPVETAADETLEAAKLDDVKTRLLNATRLIESNRHLPVSLNASDRINNYLARWQGFSVAATIILSQVISR